jgi:hypothetical protein
MNSKIRRDSGRVMTKIYDPVSHPYEEVLWNDWIDHRDGFREYFDATLKKASYIDWGYGREAAKKHNEKIKKLTLRRKLRKAKNQ